MISGVGRYIEYDDDPEPHWMPPDAVLIPVLSFVMASAVAAIAATASFAGIGRRPEAGVLLAGLAVVCLATGVGLWRRWRWAHTFAVVVAGLAALMSLGRDLWTMAWGIGLGVWVVWSLSTKSAKDWFGFR
jgi:uncharacterized membrane protein (DUF2068 family)